MLYYYDHNIPVWADVCWLLRSQDVPRPPTGSGGREEKRDHGARSRFPSLNKCRQRSFFEDTEKEVSIARVDWLGGCVFN